MARACFVFIFLILCSLTRTSATSPPGIRWTRGYTNGACEAHNHAGVQTSDGGFFLVGDGECYDTPKNFTRQITAAKVDHAGNEEWMTNIGTVGFNYGKFGIELADRTFLVAGSLSENVANVTIEKRALIRLSAGGKVLRTQTFPSTQTGRLDGLMGLAIAGPNLVVATGYVGGIAGYPDQPAFLIQVSVKGAAGAVTVERPCFACSPKNQPWRT